MIEYSIIDKNGTSHKIAGASITTALNDSLTATGSASKKRATIVERSYGDGSVKVGSDSYAESQIDITRELAFEDDASARAYVNALMALMGSAVYLVDDTNGIRVRVSLDTAKPEWEEGSYLRSGKFSASFILLDAFWEDEDETTATYNVTAEVPLSISFNNTGFSEAPFNALIEVASQVSAVSSVEIQTSDQSIEIASSNFGKSGFTQLLIDTKEGTAKSYNSTTGIYVDEQGSFVSGTGFFKFPVGHTPAILRCSVDAAITIAYRKRYFV